MNFKTSVIFGIVFTFSFCAVEAMAKCTSVEAGKFCKETMKLNCRGGCYCLGSSSGTSVSAAGSVNVASVCNEEYTDSGTLPSGTSQWEQLNAAGVYRCPKNFKHSASKSDSPEDCYGKCGNAITGTWIYNKPIQCAEGKYLKKAGNSESSCEDCPAGSFCQGGSWLPSCTEDQGKTACPSNFPNSAKKAKAKTDCFNSNNEYYTAPLNIQNFEKLNYSNYNADAVFQIVCKNNQVFCGKGYWLPSYTSACEDCPVGYYCDTAKCYTKNVANAQGAKQCPDGTVSPSKSTSANQCVSFGSCPAGKIECGPGFYFNVNTASLTDCPAGYYCPGVCVSQTGSDEERGLRACPDGTTSEPKSFAQSHCHTVNNTISVDPGEYLPANSTTPASCTNATIIKANQYCPGGTFAKNNVAQGIETCLYNGVANPDKKSCKITVTKEQLKNGISGNSKCYYMIKDPEQYRACVFGR